MSVHTIVTIVHSTGLGDLQYDFAKFDFPGIFSFDKLGILPL